MVKFNSGPDKRLLTRIIARAVASRLQHGIDMSKDDEVSLRMDLSAANGVNGNDPIDLERLLAADDFNFAHDVFGIERNMDRETGSLGHFLPRFARTRAAA